MAMATQQQQRPLALDYAAHGAAKGWRANEHLIDALPYVDHVPQELKSTVDALIEEEKRRSTKLPSDYLRELPHVRAPQFDDHPVLKTEYERVRSKQPMQALDTVRYRLDPPPQTKRGDVNAWKHSLDNAHSQLEHQHLRVLNQELLLKHGDKSWRAQVQLDEATVKSLELQLVALKKETDQLNRERKLQQHAAGSELSKLERQYMAQVRKNFDIERACDRLEDEVAAMEAEMQLRIRADTEAKAGDQEGGQVANGPNGASTAAMEGVEEGGQAAMDGVEEGPAANGAPSTDQADVAVADAAVADAAVADAAVADAAATDVAVAGPEEGSGQQPSADAEMAPAEGPAPVANGTHEGPPEANGDTS